MIGRSSYATMAGWSSWAPLGMGEQQQVSPAQRCWRVRCRSAERRRATHPSSTSRSGASASRSNSVRGPGKFRAGSSRIRLRLLSQRVSLARAADCPIRRLLHPPDETTTTLSCASSSRTSTPTYRLESDAGTPRHLQQPQPVRRPKYDGLDIRRNKPTALLQLSRVP